MHCCVAKMRVKFHFRTPNRSEDMGKKLRMGPQSFTPHLHVQDTPIAGVAQSCQRGNLAKFCLQTHSSTMPSKHRTLLTKTMLTTGSNAMTTCVLWL